MCAPRRRARGRVSGADPPPRSAGRRLLSVGLPERRGGAWRPHVPAWRAAGGAGVGRSRAGAWPLRPYSSGPPPPPAPPSGPRCQCLTTAMPAWALQRQHEGATILKGPSAAAAAWSKVARPSGPGGRPQRDETPVQRTLTQPAQPGSDDPVKSAASAVPASFQCCLVQLLLPPPQLPISLSSSSSLHPSSPKLLQSHIPFSSHSVRRLHLPRRCHRFVPCGGYTSQERKVIPRTPVSPCRCHRCARAMQPQLYHTPPSPRTFLFKQRLQAAQLPSPA